MSKLFTAFFLMNTFSAWATAQTFTSTGMMQVGHEGHTATLLNSGLVLVTGGVASSTSSVSNIAELYNPTTGTWRYTGQQQQTFMSQARGSHTATKLQDGRVLIAGGGSNGTEFISAEIFDPNTETLTPVHAMNQARSNHRAVLLNDGRVLVVGGYSTSTAETYSPSTDSWMSFSLPTGAEPAIALLPNGKVLVTGGNFGSTRVDMFDPASNTWQSMVPMLHPRWTHSATALPKGNVLIVGGNDGSIASYTSEIYDPSVLPNGQSVLGPNVDVGGWFSSAAALPNGDVLIAGGHNFPNAPINYACSITTTNAQLYSYNLGTMSDVGPMHDSRTSFTAITLQNGSVLVAGGAQQPQCGVSTVINAAEVWCSPSNDSDKRNSKRSESYQP